MPVQKRSAAPDWELRLREMLPLFGHRNWIVVADSAYPAQSKPGIETVFAGGSQVEAAGKVLDAISGSAHLRANIYVDRELASVAESDAPGILAYRAKLEKLLGPAFRRLPHEEIIAKLDQAAQTFRVLVVKTAMTIPYTSVFFELECGYWNGAAEERLRRAMNVR
jgi:RbsD / FucU transport protein family